MKYDEITDKWNPRYGYDVKEQIRIESTDCS